MLYSLIIRFFELDIRIGKAKSFQLKWSNILKEWDKEMYYLGTRYGGPFSCCKDIGFSSVQW